jgi:hypothetical protein
MENTHTYGLYTTICKIGRSLYHNRDRIVAVSGTLQIYTESANLDFSTVDLKKIAAKHKQIMNKKH